MFRSQSSISRKLKRNTGQHGYRPQAGIGYAERKSKLRLALPVAKKTAEAVTSAMIDLSGGFKDWVHTITFDNDKNLPIMSKLRNLLNVKTISPNITIHGNAGRMKTPTAFLRQYFSKAMGLLDLTTMQMLEAVHKLNSRPRKCLGFRTP